MTTPHSEPSRQLHLFEDPRPIVPRDPNIAPEAVPRLGGQSAIILARLREGPCTSRELTRVSHRFGARLHDLRGAGCVIRTVEDKKTGISTYTLLHEPPGL